MKKIFGFLMVMMMTMFIGVKAQTVEASGWGDNWFVGANVGAVAPVPHSFDWANHGLQAYRFEWGVEAGKWITPVVGLGVSYEAQVNTTVSKTAFDLGTALADVHFNLSNLFAGYKGEPRAWEFELIPSVGYVHYYGGFTYKPGHRFFAMSRVALSADYNFGKAKEWTAYVRPGVQYVDRIRDTHGQFDVRVGLVYKIKGKQSKSHNFVLCPYSVTQADYDAALARINELEGRQPEVKVQTVEVVKEVVKEVASNKTAVNFAFNSAELSADAKAALDAIPADATVNVDAYASEHGGTKTANKLVSDKRADVVKAYLEARGVKVANVTSHGAENAYTARVAVVTVL